MIQIEIEPAWILNYIFIIPKLSFPFHLFLIICLIQFHLVFVIQLYFIHQFSLTIHLQLVEQPFHITVSLSLAQGIQTNMALFNEIIARKM